jgi:hypothetical protein
MPKKQEPTFLDIGKRAGAAASIVGLTVLALSVGPCQAEWKFITTAEASEIHKDMDLRHQNLKKDLARIEGKIDLLTELNKDVIKGIEDE